MCISRTEQRFKLEKMLEELESGNGASVRRIVYHYIFVNCQRTADKPVFSSINLISTYHADNVG